MEIKELITIYMDESSEILEVSFRTIDDQDDEIRQDEVSFNEIEKFGYDFAKKDSNFDYMSEDDEFELNYEENENNLDREDVISFLNEYYLIYPDKLPKAEIF